MVKKDTTANDRLSHRPRVFDVVDRDGNARRYTNDDLDELFETNDEAEMRRHIGLGWLLVDESVHRDPGKKSWFDQTLRLFAGRKLGPGEDPSYVAPSDTTTYILGHLRNGAVRGSTE